MTKIIYKVSFFDDWHCGSGLSAGADVDALVIKDQSGLPYIPGRTIKGLLREAAQYLCEFASEKQAWKEFLQQSFGEGSDKSIELSQQGGCYFSNAELSNTIKTSFLGDSNKINILYRKLASTAIGDDGQAEEHSLRKMEVVVPLLLFGEIDKCFDVKKMNKCLKWVKRLGNNRHRGLGRCDFEIKTEE